MSKDYNKAYIDDNELGFIKEVVRPNFRKRGEYEAGDAVFWDSEFEMFRVAPYEEIDKITDKVRFTPTGVVVIPSSHDVYGTGEAGVTSIKNISTRNPDEGTFSQSNDACFFGPVNEKDVPGLHKYSKVVCVGTKETGIHDTVQSVVPFNGGTSNEDSCHMPVNYIASSSYEYIDNPYDPGTKYSNHSYGELYYLPSPYKANGTRNPLYYSIEYGDNVLSDFNGKSNTEILCARATAQPNWKTDDTIVNDNEGGYYPAACCCWRFHTVGTEHGDWYLPAAGELGYKNCRWKEIEQTTIKLRQFLDYNNLGEVFTSIGSTISTDRRDYYGSCIYTNNLYGHVSNQVNYLNTSVVPFTRLR